jgi:hypothetical protein
LKKKLHLKKKYNQGWKENVPDYPSTEYTRLYSTIVNMNWHKSDLAKRVIQVQVNFSKTLIPKHSSSVKYILTIELKGGDTYDG